MPQSPDNMDAKTRTVLTRAGTTLAGAGTIIVVALALNAPSTVRVEFDVACRSFLLPAAATLGLNRQPTQIASATFYGFDGLITGNGINVWNAEDPAAPKPLPLSNQRYPLLPLRSPRRLT